MTDLERANQVKCKDGTSETLYQIGCSHSTQRAAATEKELEKVQQGGVVHAPLLQDKVRGLLQ